MFSKNVARTDAFLDMSQTAQNLYFHLGIDADDDGFVSPKMIMRMLGSTSDDLKILIAKGFVLPFDDGVIVIRHWRVNNEIRQDRYKETQYTDHKEKLGLHNGVYDLVLPMVPPSGNQMATQVRLGKVSIGKDINTLKSRFEQFWERYPRKVGRKKAEEFWLKLHPSEELTHRIIAAVESHKKTSQWTKDGGQFIPHATTFLNQERWNDEVFEEEPSIPSFTIPKPKL